MREIIGQPLNSENRRQIQALIALVKHQVIPQKRVQTGEEPFESWETGTGQPKEASFICYDENRDGKKQRTSLPL